MRLLRPSDTSHLISHLEEMYLPEMESIASTFYFFHYFFFCFRLYSQAAGGEETLSILLCGPLVTGRWQLGFYFVARSWSIFLVDILSV